MLFLALYPLVALLMGFALGVAAKFTGGWRPLLLFLLIPSCAPWLGHLLYVENVDTTYTGPSIDSLRFVTVSVGLASALLIMALVAARREPLSASFFPLLLGLLYYHIPFASFAQVLFENEILYDSFANFVLAVLSLTVSVGLFGYALTWRLEPHTLGRHLALRS